jgi:putative membrane protein
MSSASSPQPSDRSFFLFNAAVSIAALALLSWLLLFHGGMQGANVNLRFLTAVNACLNATAAALLVAGWVAIKTQRAELHRYFMVSAFAASACFLVGYLAYHAVHGDTKFGGVGAVRLVYLVLLASHVLLSLFIVPLCLTAFWFAWKREFKRHAKVTRWLHPIWLYVSVTGVIVFLMLRPYYPA